jgi:hypothetical protein
MALVDDRSAVRDQRRETLAMQRMFRALARIGVDLQTVPATSREAIELADRNIAKLAEIERTMSRRTAPTAPTPERLAHAIDAPREIEVTPGQPVAHRFEWALEAIRDRLPSRNYDAAARLRDAFLASEPASRVADPTAVGGSSDPSKRLAITERQERASKELAWIMGRLDQPFRGIVKNFVLEIVKQGSERCLSVPEWGSRLTGHAGAAAARAAGVAAIIMATARLATLWDAYDVTVREHCSKTDRMMRSVMGRRAAQGGWIIALWEFCHRKGRHPTTQGDVDMCRAAHDAQVKELRTLPPMELDRWHRRRDRLISVAFCEAGFDRIRI